MTYGCYGKQNYYGSLEEIKPKRTLAQCMLDETIERILEKGCQKLIQENEKKWKFFEKTFLMEFRALKKEVYLLAKQDKEKSKKKDEKPE